VTATPELIETTRAAAMLRADMHAAYPGVRFSVRKGRGTACWWLAVTYTDGPTTRQVEQITARYPAERYSQNTGRREPAPAQLVTLDPAEPPRLVRFAVDGIDVHREIGSAGRAAVAARIRQVAPGVRALNPDGALTDEILTPEQAAQLGATNYAHGIAHVSDIAWPVFCGIDLTN
jgi:hypothetical protein